jgi:hypothetical protein
VSGDAMLIWADKSKSNMLRYSIWNGVAWKTKSGASGSEGVPGYFGGEPQWIQIASRPGHDEIVVAIADGDDNVYAGGSSVDYVVVWDGDDWGDVLELDRTGSNALEQPSISVAYESYSGRAMVVYGVSGSTNIRYRIWNAGGWGAAQTLSPPSGITGIPYWTDLKANCNMGYLNYIILGVHTSNKEVWFNVWNGTSWISGYKPTTSTYSTDGSSMAVAFESNSGDGIVVWGVSGSAVIKYALWNGVWMTANALNPVGNKKLVRGMELYADPAPDSGGVMLVWQDEKELYADFWDNGWLQKSVDKLDTTNIVTDQPFTFMWTMDEKNAIAVAPSISTPPPSSSPSTSAQPSIALPDGTAIWTVKDVTNAKYRDFKGTYFDAALTGPNIGINADNKRRWLYVQGATSPNADEKFVVGVTDEKRMTAMKYSSGSWALTHPTGGNYLDSGADVSSNVFNNAIVGYESQSGCAMLVWNDGKSKKPKYSIWGGSSWATGVMELSSYPATVDSVEPLSFDIASDPNSNALILLIVDKSKALYTAYWNGNVWTGPSPINLGAGNTLQSETGAAVAFESTSGDALLVYGRNDASNVRYLTRINGTSTWSTDTVIPSFTLGNKAERTMLRSDPTSNRVVLGVIDGAKRGWTAIWNGASWTSQIELPSVQGQLTGNAYPSIAVAFESFSGKALAVYGEKDSTLVLSQIWNGSTWVKGKNAGTVAKTTLMTLTSNPSTNEIMMLVQDEGKDLFAWLWDGTWSSFPVLNDAVNNDVEGTLPFVYLWDTGY